VSDGRPDDQPIRALQTPRRVRGLSIPEEWESFFQAIPQPTIILDPSHGIVSANRAALKALNKKERDVIGSKCYDLFHGREQTVAGCPMEKLLSEGWTETIEMEMETIHGTFLVSCTPILDEKGKIARIVHIATDVTNLKKTQKELQESREEYHTHFANTSDVFYSLDRDAKIVHVSPSVEKILGYRPDELIGKAISELPVLSPESLNQALSNIGRLLSGEKVETAEYTFLAKDGSKRIGEVTESPLRAEDGAITGIIAVARDVTERKENEKALRHTQFIMDHSSESIHELTADGRLVYVNDVMCKSLGYSREELLSMTVFDLDLNVSPEIHRKNWENLKRKDSITFETMHRRKEGTTFPVEIKITHYRHGGEEFGIASGRDITERRLAEQQILESERSLLAILSASPIGIGKIKDRVFSWVNDTLCRISGYTAEELTGKSSRLLYESDEEYERVGKDLYDKEGRVETRVVTKSGSVRDVVMRVSPTDSHSYIFTIGDVTEQKRAEETLRFTQFAVDKARDIVMWHGESGEILYANDAAVKATGYTREELLSMDVFDIDPDLSPEAWKRNWSERKKVGAIYRESRHRRKDGRIYPVEVSSSHVEYKGRGYVCAFLRDITERKKAEARLRESEECYRVAIENSNDGVSIIREGKHLYVNRRFAEMFGYDGSEEITGNPIGLFTHPDDLEMVRGINARRQRGDPVPKRYEFRGIKRDGTPIYVEVSAVDTVYQGRPAFLTYLRDITERRHAEQALQESEAKYRNVVENSFVGFYVIQDQLFRFVNKRFCEILGYSYEEMVDRMSPLSTVHPDDREKVKQNLKNRLTKEEGSIQYTFRAIRKNGSVITVKVMGTTLSFNGRPAAMGSFIDITREETLESQLRQAQKMEAVGTLAGGVAHDFNNIITVISGYGSLLSMAIEATSSLRAYIDPILISAEQAANLTRSLLAFSRQQPVSLTPLNLNQCIKKAGKILKRLLTEDVELVTSFPSDEIIIMADPTQMEQILFNLATNARDAMRNGGKLAIETKCVELDHEFITMHGYGEPGRYALLTVTDTGSGMDDATRQKIFDPFFTTKDIGKGTGLGLSTVYGIVKQHNGYINVYSEPYLGTTFHIYFPVVKALTREEKPLLPEIKGGNETILVAEDNEDVRHFIHGILSRYGYTIVESFDGEDAVTKFRSHGKIDLMILDSVMPKKNGRAVYDEARETDPDVKVLFTSGYTRDIVLDKGIEEQQFDFIPKPIMVDQLLMKVREILDR
jgi:two-component system, cell cycle sensor histidine kinase and response regulator CckA